MHQVKRRYTFNSLLGFSSFESTYWFHLNTMRIFPFNSLLGFSSFESTSQKLGGDFLKLSNFQFPIGIF